MAHLAPSGSATGWSITEGYSKTFKVSHLQMYNGYDCELIVSILWHQIPQ